LKKLRFVFFKLQYTNKIEQKKKVCIQSCDESEVILVFQWT